MRFERISPKQAEVFKFPHYGYDALICDGAVRSGKTVMMTVSFVMWAMSCFDGMNFGICGKTVRSAERNIIAPLMQIKSMTDRYAMKYTRQTNLLAITYKGKTNYFYLFGGKDESSYMLIQGITLAGVLLDEVALMTRSFVEQALARCSVDGSLFWFNCNPDNPNHWFYTEWILKAKERNALHLHFLMDDNPGLSAKTLERYKNNHTGVFYDRYILGKWVRAEGLIYPMFSDKPYPEGHVVDASGYVFSRYMISIDYGTMNPFSAGLWGYSDGVWVRIREHYHDGRKLNRQLTDEEYLAQVLRLADGLPIQTVIIDPSAASFITALKRKGGLTVRLADNAVVDGIRDTAVALQKKLILIDRSCKDCINEFYAYSWDEKAAERGEDKPLKDNDHAMDDIRYMVKTNRLVLPPRKPLLQVMGRN